MKGLTYVFCLFTLDNCKMQLPQLVTFEQHTLVVSIYFLFFFKFEGVCQCFLIKGNFTYVVNQRYVASKIGEPRLFIGDLRLFD